MMYYLLREQHDGTFALTGEVLDTTADDAVEACAARTADTGNRCGLWPYDAVRRTPATAPEAALVVPSPVNAIPDGAVLLDQAPAPVEPDPAPAEPATPVQES